MQMERESVGNVEAVDAPVNFGWNIVKDESGSIQVQRRIVDGWLLPLRESQRIQQCTSPLGR